MTDVQIQQALEQSAVEVLEKMFFLSATEQAVEEFPCAAGDLVAQLSFDGDPPGRFQLALTRLAAASIAGNFLGEDPSGLSGRQVAEVTGELANMICGAVLSRIESTAVFRLSEPNILDAHAAALPQAGLSSTGLSCTLDTGDGPLRVAIQTDRAL